MAITSFTLDPNAQSYTDDQIVGKVNTASANITRAGSVDAAARPVVAGEIGDPELGTFSVSNTELVAGVVKTNLDSMADAARGYIKTSPAAGEFPVISVQKAGINLDISYDSVAIGNGFTSEGGFSVGGSLTDGGSITITGSGFGTKPFGAQPYMLIEFGINDSDPHSLSRGSWAHTWDANTVLAQNAVAPNRTHSFEYSFYQDGLGHGALNGAELDMGASKLELYLFSRIHYNFDGHDMFDANSSYNLKGFRYWEPGIVNKNLRLLSWGGGQARSVGGSPRINSENSGGGSHYYATSADLTHAVFGLRKNEWITEELEMENSSAVDVNDGTTKHSVNGYANDFAPGAAQGTVFTSRTTALPALYQELFMHQESTVGNPGFQMKISYDVLYVDDSLCHIIISEEAAWDAATAPSFSNPGDPEVFYVREPQIPTAWADTSITCQIRQGTHASLSGKYLYVIDSSGVSQKIGQFT